MFERPIPQSELTQCQYWIWYKHGMGNTWNRNSKKTYLVWLYKVRQLEWKAFFRWFFHIFEPLFWPSNLAKVRHLWKSKWRYTRVLPNHLGDFVQCLNQWFFNFGSNYFFDLSNRICMISTATFLGIINLFMPFDLFRALWHRSNTTKYQRQTI